MRGKKLVLVSVGVVGAGAGVLAGVGSYEENRVGRVEAVAIIVAVPVAAVLVARRVARRFV